VPAPTVDTDPTTAGTPAPARARLGLAQVTAAAVLFGANASIAKVALEAGIGPRELAALRCTGVAVGLAAVAGPVARSRLRLPLRHVPQVAVLGVVGAAMIQWLYFVAIDRVPVGIAILVEFTGPVLVALWVRLVQREQVRAVMWASLALSLAGLALVAEVWRDADLDPVGVGAALGAAVCLATFLLVGRRTGGALDPLAVNVWMFAFAAAFWSVVEPVWAIDREPLGRSTSLLGALDGAEAPVWAVVVAVVVLGTLAPYALDLAALRHLSPATVGAVGMLEPVVAAGVAWAWLGQSLAPVQLVGGAVVLAGVALAQLATGALGRSRARPGARRPR